MDRWFESNTAHQSIITSFKDQFSKQNNCAHNATITLILIDRKVSMKKIIAALAFIASSVSIAQVSENRVVISEAASTVTSFVISSYNRSNESATGLFEITFKKPMELLRVYVKVNQADCLNKYGTYFYRFSINDEWKKNDRPFVLPPKLVGDSFAATLCSIMDTQDSVKEKNKNI